MSQNISACKGQVTRQSNTLRKIMETNADVLKVNFVFPSDKEECATYIKGQLKVYMATYQALNKSVELGEKSIEKFINSIDQLDEELSDEAQETTDKFVNEAMEVVEKARLQLIALGIMESELREERDQRERQQGTPIVSTTPQPQQSTVRSTLPPIPLPTFAGDMWEWDQFWGVFTDAMSSQPLSDQQKMYYLMSVLKGEAKEAVQRYQINGSDFTAVSNHLISKFGNKEVITKGLYGRLEKIQSEGRGIRAQRRTLDNLVAVLDQLKVQGENVDGTLLQTIVQGKFTDNIQRQVIQRRRALPATTAWTTTRLITELEDIVVAEEEITNMMGRREEVVQSAKSTSDRRQQHNDRDSMKDNRNAVNKKINNKGNQEKRPISCFYCDQTGHRPYQCTVVAAVKDRMEIMRKKSLCTLCGSSRHLFKDCTSKTTCYTCGKKHHGSLCFKAGKEESQSTKMDKSRQGQRDNRGGPRRTPPSQNFVSTNDNEEDCQQESNNVAFHVADEPRGNGKVHILIGEAKVLDQTTQRLVEVQVLLDTGSELSFVSSELASQLHLPIGEEVELSISTFGSTTSSEKKCNKTEMQLWDAKGSPHVFSLLTCDVLTNRMASRQLSEEDWKYIDQRSLPLSMKRNTSLVKPQILLGCEDLWDLLDDVNGQQHSLPSVLRLVPSHLGYLVTGKQGIPKKVNNVNPARVNTVLKSTEEELALWDKYWTMDSSGIEEYAGPEKVEKSETDRQVLENFRQKIEKREDGYYVALPWKSGAPSLPDNKSIAYNRLKSVLLKFKSQPKILQQYHQTFIDQLKKGVIEEVNEPNDKCGPVIHYLAHQAVITPQKDTTKLRIVFDASAHYKDKPCLNDVLHQGPLIMPEMYGMLLRFRCGGIAVISDVEKAFLQVRLQEQDRDATRCLWVRDITQPLTPENVVTYRFARVTFGLNTSPFLLAATIQFHLDNINEEGNLVSEVKDNLYVDNLLMTADTPEEAIGKYKKTKSIFNDMNMNLREFLSSSGTVNSNISESDRAVNQAPKVLGIKWDSSTDELELHGTLPERQKVTKRTVTEQIASVYDPLGWLTPLMLPAKLFLQKLWKEGYTWDQQLKPEHAKEWSTFQLQVNGFVKRIPRSVSTRSDGPKKLVTFADASGVAMATCVYLCDAKGAHLLMAKSKLPSVKETPTMPKMEMNAITMGARLTLSVFEALKDSIQVNEVFIFSDSEITLKWLESPPGKKTTGVLVSNRIAETRKIIRQLATSGPTVQFGYVNTKVNPADCGTRGLTSTDLQDHYWWTGPEFIHHAVNIWSTESRLFTMIEDSGEEETSAKIMSISSKPEENDIAHQLIDWSRHSSLRSAKKSMAYVLRFIERVSRKVQPELRQKLVNSIPYLKQCQDNDVITTVELKNGEKTIVQHHQRTTITEQLLKKMKNLRVQKDNEGILRCCGRMDRSDLQQSAKRPMLIASRSKLSTLIIRDIHNEFHLGTAHTMAEVRQHYWIPQLRQQVRTIAQSCLPCQKMNNLPFRYPEMQNLPGQRVQRSSPFRHCGLDYFGPLACKTTEGELTKVYGCILTCMTTRMIHLELVNDMTTEKFINALRRFFARRGVPETITSDNGPNFLLREQILRDAVKPVVNDTSLARTMATKGIEWRTITPYAPWQGAVYERLIKSLKHSLYKVIGKSTLTTDEMSTILTEIEGSLNTRPLTYQEERWEDQPILRPIDFLQRDMVITYPLEHMGGDYEDADYLPPEEAVALRTRRQAEAALKTSHKMTERFWDIWSKQYLTSLRESHKQSMEQGRSTNSVPKEGRVVLICDPNQPRNCWKVGRITKVNRGSDNIVREVELKAPNGRTIRRPVNLVIPLEKRTRSICQMSSNSNKNQRLYRREDTTSESANQFHMRSI